MLVRTMLVHVWPSEDDSEVLTSLESNVCGARATLPHMDILN